MRNNPAKEEGRGPEKKGPDTKATTCVVKPDRGGRDVGGEKNIARILLGPGGIVGRHQPERPGREDKILKKDQRNLGETVNSSRTALVFPIAAREVQVEDDAQQHKHDEILQCL